MRLRSLLLRVVAVALLGAALLLTTARIVQPDEAPWPLLVAFTPLALAPYLVAALLVLGPALGRRRGAVVLLALAVAGVAVHLWWLAPLLTGGRPAPAAGSEPLTVMFLSMDAGRADPRQVVAAAADRDVDVLGLGEVTADALAALQGAGLVAQFPHRAGLAGPGATGTMLFSRHPVVKASSLPTGYGSVRARLDVDGRELRVLAVRLRPLDDVAGWSTDHAQVLEAAQGGVDLVLGDLNATLDHERLQRLERAGMRDVTELVNGGWQPTWPAQVVPLVQLDHVLVGDDLTGLSSDVVRIDDTDHGAVVAQVAWR
jgi:endonuclease/exonuclease/phosphatase family metal-dependent hydrolase